MKAILCSSDITNVRGGVELAERMIGKPRDKINIAVINEASAVEFGNHRWAIDAMRHMADHFGGSIEIVHLLALTPEKILERINAAAMVFVLGGNTEYLKSVFDKTGFSKMFPEILKDKLYVGNSAGSMILGHQPSYRIQMQMYGGDTDLNFD
ncbi:MAG: peptidase E, partial [Proteobacteria bacterium]|nr:peptidase E [Pseudomonadota bacterium]